MSQPGTSGRRRLRRALLLAALPLLGAVCGWLLAPGQATPYLQLQQQSDALHRGTVLAGPILAIAFVLTGLLALIFTDFRWPHRILSALAWLVLCGGLALGAYVVRFDLVLESSGSRGQFTRSSSGRWDAQQHWSRQALREEDGPGIAAAIPGSTDTLVLDRLSLSRQDTGGRRIWNRRRGGVWPGWLLPGTRYTLLALPAPRFDDDLLLQMLETNSGRLLLEFHVLGRRPAGLAASGRLAALAGWRPVESCVYVLQLEPPELRWRFCLEAPLQLPPRFQGDSLWLVAGDSLWRLAREDGRLLEQRPACRPGSGPELSCRQSRVVGWVPETPP